MGRVEVVAKRRKIRVRLTQKVMKMTHIMIEQRLKVTKQTHEITLYMTKLTL